MKLLQEQFSTLSENLEKLKLESEQKDKQIETAEAHVVALHKRSADLLLEYDRLLEDNQNRQAQATDLFFFFHWRYRKLVLHCMETAFVAS
ncbi:hypothetical protein NC651_032965 [Populus alba x Populus x berolinensis]|nr:hypothetical protein NC651_032965 [Populus alba x Populus x berolinensis]